MSRMTASWTPRDDLKVLLGTRTQTEIARRMGVSQAQLSRLLSGERKWTGLMARAFSMATGIPLAIVLGEPEREEAAV